MTQRIHLLVVILSGAIGASQSSGSNDFANGFSTIRIQEEEYASACESAELAVLRGQLVAIDVMDTNNAWKTIETMLCGRNNGRTRRFMRTIVPKRLYASGEETSSRPSIRMIARSADLVSGLLAAGRAWQATVRQDGDKLVVQYFANEACVNGRTLVHWRSHWLVSEIGQACD